MDAHDSSASCGQKTIRCQDAARVGAVVGSKFCLLRKGYSNERNGTERNKRLVEDESNRV